ncbi:hypothetical protein ACIBL3_26505 [Kribbella sp. NPDC050124]|uniref:hypothetical protein n=1 Tax=Kribbella sp. NPDC050124 TaxID=3364114 RepID=UPI0037B36EFD
MLSPSEIRHRLGEGASAALRGDRAVLDEAASWLASLTARELLRIDYHARQIRYEGPTLGQSQDWSKEVLASPVPVVAALASMHPDGYLRERAVRSLAESLDRLSDRALAVRVTDHVGVIRETAAREVLRRTSLEQADHLVPVLHRIEQRGRGADVLPQYLQALVTEHGEAEVWARLRISGDHHLRRVAVRHSFESGLLGLQDAVALLPAERDAVVRRRLIAVIADSAPPKVIATVLLRGRSAEGRAIGLVRLAAAELDSADVERLLVDRSMLMRLWGRRRWQEMWRDPITTYAEVARSAAEPIVRACAYTGLEETGTAIERQEILDLDLVHSAELPLRKVGLSLLRERATADDLPLLLSFVAGDQSRVARLAGEVLIRSPQVWAVSDLAGLKAAEDAELRRRAWWIHRNRGGWEAVVADLELLRDPDPQLATVHRQLVPPMYFKPTDAQRQRIADLLATARLDRGQRLTIAVAAGLPDLADTFKAQTSVAVPNPGPAPVAAQRPWWRIWNRPSSR